MQAMLEIREKELEYITNKYLATGTQAALVSGLAISVFTAVTLDQTTPEIVLVLFFFFSSASLITSLSCIMNATFVTVWGGNLALRGPRGSMAKAYFGMVREQSQIFGSFMLSLFFFVNQAIIGFWMMDVVPNDDSVGENLFHSYSL